MGNAICECNGIIPGLTNDTYTDAERMNNRRLVVARQRLIYHCRQKSEAEMKGGHPSHSYLMVTEEIDWPTTEKHSMKSIKALEKTKKAPL